MRRLPPLVVMLLAFAASPAPAATVAIDGTTLRFTAGAGESNHPTFHHRAEEELVVYDPGLAGRPVSAGAGCSQDGDNTVVCPRGTIARAEFTLGGSPRRAASADSLTLTAAVPVPVTVSATSAGGARVTYIDLRTIEVSLDGAPNDGPAGRGDNIGAGVDHVFGGDGADILSGNSRPNSLNGDNGSDGLAGEGGDDVLTAASFNDVGADAVGLETRGSDAVVCGAGLDTAFVDASDSVTDDCELLVRVSDLGYAYRGTRGADRIIADRGPASVRGGAGNDRLGATPLVGAVELRGETGNDKLAGNRSPDRLDGGPGADLIVARDRVRDTIVCGSGRDTVVADRRDRVAGDCERVRR